MFEAFLPKMPLQRMLKSLSKMTSLKVFESTVNVEAVLSAFNNEVIYKLANY